MAIKKTYDLSVDLKKQRVKANVPVLVQGDTTEFRLRLLDNGKELTAGQISGITGVELLSGFDAQTIIRTVGSMDGSTAVFLIPQGELFKTGQVKAMVRLTDASDRISTLYFEYQVIGDLTANYVPGEQDVTIFQQYIADAQQKIDEMAATDVQQLSEQLAGKVTKGQVTVSDIDKNKGLLDQTYLSDELKQQMAGTTPINAVPADKSITTVKLSDSAVTPETTNFFKRSIKNLLNPNDVFDYTYVTPTTGVSYVNTTNYSDMRATGDIPVLPMTSYIINKKVHSVVFYDANGAYLSGYWKTGYNPHRIEAGEPFTTPENAAIMRVNLRMSDIPAETQIEKGTIVTAFEPYFIPPLYVPEKAIAKEKLDFAVATPQDISDLEKKTNVRVYSNVTIPSKFNKWKILDDSTNASKWSYDSVNSTAIGTVTEATVVDTSKVPANFPIPEYMKKPWLFSDKGMLKGAGDLYGNKMLKFEVSANGNAIFHMPLNEREDFSQKGELAFAVWMDTVSNDVDTNAVIQQLAFHDYPASLTKHHRNADVSTGMVNGKGSWLIVSIPSIRKQSTPVIWSQQGASPYGISTLSTVDGIGFRITNTKTDGKVARFYVSGIFRMENTLDKGKLIIDFDDGFLSQYQEGFRYMNDTYGYKGNMGIVGSWVEAGVHGQYPAFPTVSVEQMLEMQEAGWDITSHTWTHKNLGFDGYSPDVILDDIQRNYRWLREKGIDKGSRFLIYPEGSWNRWTESLARQFHVTGRGGAMFTQISPTSRQFQYPGLDYAGRTEADWRSTLQTIQDHKTVSVRLFHHIGEGAYNPISVSKFRAFIDAIQEYDIDVITWSDFFDNQVMLD